MLLAELHGKGTLEKSPGEQRGAQIPIGRQFASL
jgi:hypothetical protein